MTQLADLPFDLSDLGPTLSGRIEESMGEIEWIRDASAGELLELATSTLGCASVPNPWPQSSAVDLGDLPRHEVSEVLAEHFPPGTSLARDLGDQIQLCRAFANPGAVVSKLEGQVRSAIRKFPRGAGEIKVGHNPGDVLDPFLLAANFELLSEGSIRRTIESTASHKVLMKIEDLVGHLHQSAVADMRGNFRIPEPGGTRKAGKERLDPLLNPFPGADVGQVPLPSRPTALRLFQVKSKTGTAKGGDGKRLGEQLALLHETYGADTFFAAVVGSTLKGHRSKGGVLRASAETAVLVGEAALNELTQSAVGAELLLRVYQRAFRTAAESEGYAFVDAVADMVGTFEQEAEEAGEDFLTAWLHGAVDGDSSEQDSRCS